MGVTFEDLIKDSNELLLQHCGQKVDESLVERIPSFMLAKARGVAFFFTYTVSALATVSGGNGLVIAKKPGTEEWGKPIALGLGGVGAGIAVGVHKEYQIVLLMSDSAVETMSKPSFKYATDMHIAVGPTGQAAEGATFYGKGSEDVDAFSYGATKGASIGTGIKGMVVNVEDHANAGYYGVKPASDGGPSAKELIQGSALDGKDSVWGVALLQDRLRLAAQGPIM